MDPLLIFHNAFGRFRIDGEGFRVFVERRTPVVLLELPLIALLQLLVLRDELDEAVRNGSVGLSVELSFFHSELLADTSRNAPAQTIVVVQLEGLNGELQRRMETDPTRLLAAIPLPRSMIRLIFFWRERRSSELGIVSYVRSIVSSAVFTSFIWFTVFRMSSIL